MAFKAWQLAALEEYDYMGTDDGLINCVARRLAESPNDTIGYKEAAQSGTNAFKVSGYYHTDWLPESDMQLRIEGLSTDAVYENLVRQIAGSELQTQTGDSLQTTVERTKQRAEIEKKIAALQNKIRKEKQLNRQMELNAEVKRLRKELAEYE